MLTLFQTDSISALSEIKAQAANQIRQLPAMISPIGDCNKILRYEFRCEPVNILSWLHNQRAHTKIYWSDRDGVRETGGIGSADLITGFDKNSHNKFFDMIGDRLSEDNPGLRYYGGMSFKGSIPGEPWQDFAAFKFIVPRFEMCESDGQCVFAFNIKIGDIDQEKIAEVLGSLDSMDFTAQTQYRNVPRILDRQDRPEKREWQSIFNQSQERAPEKVVLARQSVFDFDVALRCDALMKHLKDRTPGCFHFFFQFAQDSAFLGASPERLFKRDGRGIASEAIAGTRPRSNETASDQAFEDELMNSEKDAKEHLYVTDAIYKGLNPLCTELRFDDAFSLRKLKGSQHLITRFEGQLKEGIDDLTVLNSLHPTPAVAGTPTQTALKAIEGLEPFDRGWYAGPVGTIGLDETEFAVAIRCGLIHGRQLSLFAGAGIVEGSTAEAEWDEIENKISNFMKVFQKRSS